MDKQRLEGATGRRNADFNSLSSSSLSSRSKLYLCFITKFGKRLLNLEIVLSRTGDLCSRFKQHNRSCLDTFGSGDVSASPMRPFLCVLQEVLAELRMSHNNGKDC
jgi:hypothetical protein